MSDSYRHGVIDLAYALLDSRNLFQFVCTSL